MGKMNYRDMDKLEGRVRYGQPERHYCCFNYAQRDASMKVGGDVESEWPELHYCSANFLKSSMVVRQ